MGGMTRPSIEALLKDIEAQIQQDYLDGTMVSHESGLLQMALTALRALLTDAETREGEAFTAGWFADRKWNHETEQAEPWSFTAEHSSIGGSEEAITEALAAYRQQKAGSK